MYAELIYTRCRNGIDILKGRPITSDGYKVYACSSSLLTDDKMDLQLLLSAAQAKQPYNEPNFMDDAYLFYVPEKGDSFMLNFYPVPFDPNAKGDYAHRAGNFVNHILIGDYSEFYPFELFRDNNVWDAKTHGEAYYYENAPVDLPKRRDISDPVGAFGLEEIGEFISAGRKEALMSAVAFLISQYELPPEERKFLVIKDESSQNIEMWIAAIEHAFSPRIAASIPFATRMDKFQTTNRYTINQMGVYQTQINFQDKNQKLRYRAMIVGVDERDRANSGAARPLANSPFVLLDGKQKKAMFDADISHQYFHFITRFDDSHQVFCRKFLQTIDVVMPNKDIFDLFSIYEIFEGTSLQNTIDMSKITAILSKYKLFNSTRLQRIYSKITADLPRFLQEDLQSALQIINWLKTISHIVGDVNATKRLTGYVCNAFEEMTFKRSDLKSAFGFWQSIKNSEFSLTVARFFVDPSTSKRNKIHIQRFSTKDMEVYVQIYFDCATIAGSVREEDIRSIVDRSLESCYRYRDLESAGKIFEMFSASQLIDAQKILLVIAKNAERGYTEFIVNLLIKYDENIIRSKSSLIEFLKKLKAERMDSLFGAVLKHRADAIKNPSEINQIIELLNNIKGLSKEDLADIFMRLDEKIILTEKNSISIAKLIQNEMPSSASCLKSAHIVALDVLSDKRQRANFTEIYNDLIPQGFPIISDSNYIRRLTDSLFKAKLNNEELEYIVILFSKQPKYIAELVSAILDITSSRQTEEWNVLVSVAVQKQDPALIDAIVQACTQLKQAEKTLALLNDILKSKKNRDFFGQLSQKSREIIRSQKTHSGLFGKFFSKDDDSKRRR